MSERKRRQPSTGCWSVYPLKAADSRAWMSHAAGKEKGETDARAERKPTTYQVKLKDRVGIPSICPTRRMRFSGRS